MDQHPPPPPPPSSESSTTHLVPSLGHFTYPNVPVTEIADFYSIAHCQPPQPDRPYVWSNSIVSLDGYLSFLEPDDMGVEGISMKKRFPHLSSVDFKMLHAGWAHADAILITASCLRNEPKARIRVLFDDLIDYRVNVLKKPTPQPAVIVLSRTGDIPWTHPTFQVPDQHVHVVVPADHAVPVPWPHVYRMTAMHDLFRFLAASLNVRHVDVATGGIVIHQLIAARLLDEMRMTYAAHLCGSHTVAGDLRPSFFPSPTGGFTGANAPQLQVVGVRLAGDRLVFLRMRVEYRHGKAEEAAEVGGGDSE